MVVVNADKVAVTGKKADQKMYYRHSGRPGGMKTENFKHLQRVTPDECPRSNTSQHAGHPSCRTCAS